MMPVQLVLDAMFWTTGLKNSNQVELQPLMPAAAETQYPQGVEMVFE